MIIFDFLFRQPLLKIDVFFLDQSNFNYFLQQKPADMSNAEDVVEHYLNKVRIILYSYIKVLYNWSDSLGQVMAMMEFGNELSDQLMSRDVKEVIGKYGLLFNDSVKEGRKYTSVLDDYAINVKSIKTYFAIGGEMYYSRMAFLAWIFAVGNGHQNISKLVARGIKKINNRILKNPEQDLALLAEEVSRKIFSK